MAKFNATGVYAFVAWIASMVVFVVFLIWAFSPRSLFHEMGITYYPSRYYALALPAYMIMLVFVINMSYIGINMMMTLDPDDMRTIRDSQSRSSPNVFIKCSTIGGTSMQNRWDANFAHDCVNLELSFDKSTFRLVCLSILWSLYTEWFIYHRHPWYWWSRSRRRELSHLQPEWKKDGFHCKN